VLWLATGSGLRGADQAGSGRSARSPGPAKYHERVLFPDISQRRSSESLRSGADGRFEDSAPCRSPPPATGIFEATSLTASRGCPGNGRRTKKNGGPTAGPPRSGVGENYFLGFSAWIAIGLRILTMRGFSSARLGIRILRTPFSCSASIWSWSM